MQVISQEGDLHLLKMAWKRDVFMDTASSHGLCLVITIPLREDGTLKNAVQTVGWLVFVSWDFRNRIANPCLTLVHIIPTILQVLAASALVHD